MITPEAYFDTLEISNSLEISLSNIATSEIHLFSYISCLLSIFRGMPVSDWGYSFAVTTEGYPYSPAIEIAIKALNQEGSLTFISEDYYNVTQHGTSTLAQLREFETLNNRIQFLRGASDSSLTMPIGTIRNALSQEISIKTAMKVDQSRLLPNDMASELLHEQFESLNKAIGIEIENLMIPAVVWLTYLSESSSL